MQTVSTRSPNAKVTRRMPDQDATEDHAPNDGASDEPHDREQDTTHQSGVQRFLEGASWPTSSTFVLRPDHWSRLGLNVASNVAGAIIISVLFFIFSDYIFTLPNLNGPWQMTLTVDSTAYTPHENMQVKYDVLLFQQGSDVRGTGEKVMDIVGSDTTRYIGAQRVRIEIEGYLDRNYLARDELVLHYIESGKKRRTSAFQELIRFNEDYMLGGFTWTASNSKGHVEWTR